MLINANNIVLVFNMFENISVNFMQLHILWHPLATCAVGTRCETAQVQGSFPIQKRIAH